MQIKRLLYNAALIILIFTMINGVIPAQDHYYSPELMAWGNLQGIRLDGQLMEFESSIRIAGPEWREVRKSAKEKQRSRYRREGARQIVDLMLDSLLFTEVVEQKQAETRVEVSFECRQDTDIAGTFFCISLPPGHYYGGDIELIEPATPSITSPAVASGPNEILRMKAMGVRFNSPKRQLEIRMEEPDDVIVKVDAGWEETAIDVYFPITAGKATEGQTARKIYTLKAAGEMDKAPVDLVLDPSRPGRAFDGLGGNFRIQNPRVDPAVIDYCLENLRVSWGRVEMPWHLWHPVDSIDPVEAARTNGLHPRVKAAMEMAQRLDRMGMPVLLADWWAPDWAIIGPRRRGPNPDGTRGNPLNPERMDEIYASITAYILYLKEEYGVEAAMFSFNESDLGIDIRQTGQEHADLIKGLGAYFASKGLDTKLLLGDTADARGHPFIKPALNDAETYPFIGAVSFHSWRGCTYENLAIWAHAAELLDVPLIVGEGSIDAAAWRYPEIFQEPVYSMEEINLYLRILNICQPRSILQWQLTADYSPLAGGGVFGNEEEPLHPIRRFWNLKQLASTPEGLRVMPLTSSKADITCTALGDNDQNRYAIHLVNNGATREITLRGIPEKAKNFQIFVTDEERGMAEEGNITASGGQLSFVVQAGSYVTLIH